MAEPGETLRLQPTGSDKDGGENGHAPIDDDEDYDPHVHRKLEKATNDWETLVHLIKCSLGTGILAMPQAFARSGLITGIIATIIVGALTTYCLHLLVRCQYETCKLTRVPLLTYPQAMKTALQHGPTKLRKSAPYAPLITDIFLVVYQLGICCVYIVFIAKNLKDIADPRWNVGVEAWMAMILVPLLIFNCIRNLKVLAPFSTVANVLTLIGLAIVVYFLLSNTMKKSETEIDLWGSPTTFPLFFGTILFALTAVGVVIALENNMKTPKSFGKPCGVLNIGMVAIVILYIGVGALGYENCRGECKDSITLQLPSSLLADIVKGLFAIAIFISYGLHCYVPVEVVWRGYVLPRLTKPPKNPSPSKILAAEYVLRIVLCLLTFVLAVCVPQLGLFISLFGALCLSALGICFPALMELCLRWNEPPTTSRKLVLTKDIALLIFGFIGLVAGTYTALVEIVKTFMPNSPTG